MDIWVERTAENYALIAKAFSRFGMPVFEMTLENFLQHPTWDVFTFDIPPAAIDVMVHVKGLQFEACFRKSKVFEEDGLLIRTIHLDDLTQAKRSSGRPKDISDLENLV